MLNLKIATNQPQRSDFKGLQQMQWVMADNNIKIKLEGIFHENSFSIAQKPNATKKCFSSLNYIQVMNM
jgi:hypothetical protein